MPTIGVEPLRVRDHPRLPAFTPGVHTYTMRRRGKRNRTSDSWSQTTRATAIPYPGTVRPLGVEPRAASLSETPGHQAVETVTYLPTCDETGDRREEVPELRDVHDVQLITHVRDTGIEPVLQPWQGRVVPTDSSHVT